MVGSYNSWTGTRPAILVNGVLQCLALGDITSICFVFEFSEYVNEHNTSSSGKQMVNTKTWFR